jgi:hypothetical protein
MDTLLDERSIVLILDDSPINMAWQFDAAPRDATESGMLIAALMRQVIEFMKPSVWRSGR